MFEGERNSILHGLLWGCIAIVIHLFFYLMDAPMSMWQSFLIFLIGTYFMYDTGASKRKVLGGYISWKQAVKSIWLCCIVYCFIESTYSYILMNFIDPDLVNEIKQMSIEMIEKFGGSMGEEKLEEEIAKIESQDFSGLYTNFKGFLGMIIIYFLIASLFALGIRKSNPSEIFEKYSIQNNQESEGGKS